jgi:hypothetical protein
VAKAQTNIPWLVLCEAVARVARYLDCIPEDAKLRIVSKAKAGQIKACGVTSAMAGGRTHLSQTLLKIAAPLR